MDSDLTKDQRRKLRELAGLAYERELCNELELLEGLFAQWRDGSLSPLDLCDEIHKFHQGPSRELFSRYNNSDLRLVIASAIARGILSNADAGPDMIALLQEAISLFES